MDYLKILEEQTSPRLWALVRRLGELAEARRTPLFLVGGRVRDLLLDKGGVDFDLVVEGDALELVRALAVDQGGEAVVHPRFGTATYRHDDLAVDLATSRAEDYSRPGVLPDVRPGPIEEDLKRRDFTVNAMAIPLSPPNPGSLLDQFGGREDLSNGLIRILHEGSFVDDPTRIMRAIRYEQRLGFEIEPETLDLIARDLHLLPAVGIDRLRREIELFLLEREPELHFGRAVELGIVNVIEPELRLGDGLSTLFASARRDLENVDSTIYLSLLLYATEKQRAHSFLKRFRFPKDWIQTVVGMLDLRDRETELAGPRLRPSEVYGFFKGCGRQSVQAFGVAAQRGIVRSRVSDYLNGLSGVQPDLSGKDLMSIGVPRGPWVGKFLNRLLNARLDGVVGSREEEANLVKKWLEEAAI